MKKILKNKRVLACLLVCLILVFNVSTALAAVFPFPDPKTVNVDGYKYKIVQLYNNNYILYFSNEPMTKTYGGVVKKWGLNGPCYTCDLVEGNWSTPRELPNGIQLGSTIELVYANYDVKDENGVTFFPLTVTQLTSVIRRAGLQETMHQKTLGQIVGLLPLLIPLVVGLVAFWKALHLLLRVLRKV